MLLDRNLPYKIADINRNPCRTRCRRSVVQLQHLLHSGSRRCGYRSHRGAGICMERRIAGRVLVVYGHGALFPRWQRSQPDRR